MENYQSERLRNIKSEIENVLITYKELYEKHNHDTRLKEKIIEYTKSLEKINILMDMED